MDTIVINIENGEKYINNQSLDETIRGLDSNFIDIEEIKRIFRETNSEDDFIKELRTISNHRTQITILRYILYIGNLPVKEANIFLDKINI